MLLTHCTVASSLGAGLPAHLTALRAHVCGLAPCSFDTVDLRTWTGAVAGVDAVQLSEPLAAYDCRNNRLAELGLRQDEFVEAVESAVARYGAPRVGVFVGTSTSGILQTELAYHRLDERGALPSDFRYAETHNTFSLCAYVRARFGLRGPAAVVSSACSSSANVFASAQRLLALGAIDCALVGGVDSLCLTTLYGFKSLELLSALPCRPFDAQRSGLSLGEAAAFALLERAPRDVPNDAVVLLGVGQSSDAYHMSSPHPDGLGARLAMQRALDQAGLVAADINYINLHGTATRVNDSAEGRAVGRLFGAGVPCSSTKGATGHTLGAAGGLEAVLSVLALRHGFMPASVGTAALDPDIAEAGPLDYLLELRNAPPQRVMSNSFGFGGTNCSLILGLAGDRA
ncbi:MAG: beta-ketoacyl-[acyl-carrier-protein] synthase family protein [Gammaproteobacteria bacterium]|nr:beta-ketoacyl-[acyl-carrier-protein] synthase family protein [Gammaproteobacteria bacterium]